MKEHTRGLYYGWWIVVSGFLIMALVYASVVSCQGLFIKPVTEDLGIDRASFAISTACMALGLIVGSLFAGRLIQKLGVRVVMGICCLLVAASLFGFSLCRAVWQFYLFGALSGLALPGITTLPVSVLVNHWVGKQKKGLAMSLVFAGSGVGGMLLTVLLNNIINRFHWRTAYQINAVLIAVIVLPLILFLIVETPARKGLVRLGDVPSEDQHAVTGMGAAAAKKSGVFWMLFLSVLLMSLVNAALLNHQIPYLSDIGFSSSASATLGAVAVGSLTVGKIVIGTLLDRAGLIRGAFLGNLALLLGLVILIFVQKQHGIIWLYIICYCLGASLPTVAPPLFVSTLFGERDYADLVGLINVSTGLGAIVGPTLCAKIFDLNGSYLAAWVLFAVLAAVTLVLQNICLAPARKDR